MGLTANGSVHIHHYEPLCDSACGGRCTIDLRGARWVDAFAIVAIATHCQTNFETYRSTLFIAPERREVSTYLARMGLLDVLEDFGVEVQGRISRPRFTQPRFNLVELRRFQAFDDILPLNQLVRERLAVGGKATRETQLTLWWATGEAAENSIWHSQFAHSPLAAGQEYPKTGELVIAIGDTGIGIRDSLAPVHSTKDDLDAISQAVKRGVTRTEDARGDGLTDVVESVGKLHGSVVIRSGAGALTFYSSRVRRARVMPQQGTLVGAKIPCR